MVDLDLDNLRGFSRGGSDLAGALPVILYLNIWVSDFTSICLVSVILHLAKSPTRRFPIVFLRAFEVLLAYNIL